MYIQGSFLKHGPSGHRDHAGHWPELFESQALCTSPVFGKLAAVSQCFIKNNVNHYSCSASDDFILEREKHLPCWYASATSESVWKMCHKWGECVWSGRLSIITEDLKYRVDIFMKTGDSLLISFMKFHMFPNLSSTRTLQFSSKTEKCVPCWFHERSQMNTSRRVQQAVMDWLHRPVADL